MLLRSDMYVSYVDSKKYSKVMCFRQFVTTTQDEKRTARKAKNPCVSLMPPTILLLLFILVYFHCCFILPRATPMIW